MTIIVYPDNIPFVAGKRNGGIELIEPGYVTLLKDEKGGR